jgi:hypothetical protein
MRTANVAMLDETRPCPSCASRRKMQFIGEICMHFPGGLESLGKPSVWVFPKIILCLDCGLVQFSVPEADVELIERQNLKRSA